MIKLFKQIKLDLPLFNKKKLEYNFDKNIQLDNDLKC